MSAKNFWSELRRRHVIRAAIGHAVFFWLLAQVADVVLPYVGVVDQPVRWTVIAGIALFPVTLLVAWFFEHPWHRFTGKRIVTDLTLIALIAVAAGVWTWRHLPEGLTKRTSIAVIPFSYPAGNPTAQTVSRALAYEVIGLLMKSRSIDVIHYESANSMLLAGLSAADIASRLGVEHILNGTVQVNAGLMQIRATLVNEQGQILWREELDEELEQMFKAEEELAAGVTERLGTGQNVLSIDTLAARRCDFPADPSALERYYTARHYLEIRGDGNLDELRQSISLFEGLVEDYPDFAEAMSGLAWALHVQEYYDPEIEFGSNEQRKLKLAETAYGLCDQLGEAMVFLPNEHDHPNAWISRDRQFRAAYEMQPDKIEMLDKYVRVLREVGRNREALRLARRNYESNPLSVRAIKQYASVLQASGDLDQAIELQDLAAELGSESPPFARMMKRMESCGADIDCVLRFVPPFLRGYEERLRIAYSPPQDEEQQRRAVEAAEALLAETGMINWWNVSACRFDHLTPVYFTAWQAHRHETEWYWPNTWKPRCGNVWATEEFVRLAEESGLVEYWQEIGWADYCRPAGESFVCEEPDSA